MAKIKIFELARETGRVSKDLLDKAAELGIDAKNHMAAISTGEADRLRQALASGEGDPAASVRAFVAETKDGHQVQVLEKRLGNTLIRRRARPGSPEEAAEAAAEEKQSSQAEAAPSPPPPAPSDYVPPVGRGSRRSAASVPASGAETAESPPSPAPVEASSPGGAPVSGTSPTPSETATPSEKSAEPPMAAAVTAPPAVAPPVTPPTPTRPSGPRIVAPPPPGGIPFRSRPGIGATRPTGIGSTRPTGPVGRPGGPPRPGGPARPGGFTPRPGGPARPGAPGTGPRTVGTGGMGVPRPGGPPARPGTGLAPRPSAAEEAKKKDKARAPRRPDEQAVDIAYQKGVDADVLIEEVEAGAAVRAPKAGRKTRIVFNDRRRPRGQMMARTQPATVAPKASKRVIRIPGSISVGDLSQKLGVKVNDILKKLLMLDVPATINQAINLDIASLIAADYDYKVESVAFEVASVMEEAEPDKAEDLQLRGPVVTVMGHVDHGKTSFLDYIRKTNVAGGEAGAITQHVGAYRVPVGNGHVVFLDTPGHEAFTQMRARGAKVTDLVILMVSAADSVQPQTVESIGHARAAGIPLVVALNKVDLPSANVQKTKQDLMKYELLGEDLGGDTMMFPISAKTGQGIPELLEGLLLQAEVLDLKANPHKPGRGTVIEAHMDKGHGAIATVLVQEGIVKAGDIVVSGMSYGRVKRLLDDLGKDLESGGPSTPVQVIGLDGLPMAGDDFVVVKNERQARQVVEHRQQAQRQHQMAEVKKVSLESLQKSMAEGQVKDLPLVIKVDVQGSLEAILGSLEKLSGAAVKVKVIQSGVGGINQSDVLLAGISKAVVLGFNVRPDTAARQTADLQGTEIRTYSIIYDLLDDIRKAMEGMLEPTFREHIVGRVEIREVFHIAKFGPVAGCMVTEGKVKVGSKARLIRDHKVIHTGEIGTLRRFKDAAKEVAAGYECGCTLKSYKDVKAGDQLEIFEMETVAPTLAEAQQAQA